MQKIDDQVWFITGVSSGLGRALAEAVLHAGGTVIGTTRNGEADLAAPDGKLHVLALEVTDAGQTRRVVAQAHARHGRLNVVVNNAGYGLLGSVEAATDEEAAHVFAVNFFGPLRVSEALRVMTRREADARGERGVLVNVVSIVATVGMKETAVYAASKGAITQLTKVIAVEFGGQGIRANALAPGVVETDILAGLVENSRRTLAGYGHAHALGRVAQPAEIAEAIAFLVSPAASFITGALVLADGGYTAL